MIVDEKLIQDKRADFKEYDAAADMIVEPRHRNWAQQPRKGRTYGKNWITDFKPWIKALYEAGNMNPHNKKSPEQVLEHLRRENPNRVRMPSFENVVSYFISLGTQKKDKKTGKFLERGTVGRRSVLPAGLADLIEKIVQSQPNIKPKAALALVEAKHDDELDDVTKKKITQKVNNAKTALKQSSGTHQPKKRVPIPADIVATAETVFARNKMKKLKALVVLLKASHTIDEQMEWRLKVKFSAWRTKANKATASAAGTAAGTDDGA